MNRTIALRVGVLGVALASTGLLATAVPGRAQTPGMDRRQDRRSDRDDARATRQEGRHDARDTKQACRDAGGHPIECRQQKRGVRQGARQGAREQRWND